MLSTLENTAPVRSEPLGAHMGRSAATWVPKGAPMGCSGATCALEQAARAPLGHSRALKWAARAPLGRSRALKWAAWAPLVRSNRPLRRPVESLGAHTGAREATLCAQGPSQCAHSPVLSLFCAPRAPFSAPRSRYSKPGAEPLCVRSHCLKSLFEITVRGSCLGNTVLCFTSLCFTHTGMYMPGSH